MTRKKRLICTNMQWEIADVNRTAFTLRVMQKVLELTLEGENTFSEAPPFPCAAFSVACRNRCLPDTPCRGTLGRTFDFPCAMYMV